MAFIKSHTYTPDFKIGYNRYIEAKGLFKAEDRAKHLHIRSQHPEVKIFFVFGQSGNKLNRASRTTYAGWCDKHGFDYCDIQEFDAKKLKEWQNKN